MIGPTAFDVGPHPVPGTVGLAAATWWYQQVPGTCIF